MAACIGSGEDVRQEPTSAETAFSLAVGRWQHKDRTEVVLVLRVWPVGCLTSVRNPQNRRGARSFGSSSPWNYQARARVSIDDLGAGNARKWVTLGAMLVSAVFVC